MMHYRRLAVECLASRRMLAGQITAFVQDGDLIVVGDDAANAVSVESAGAGKVQVRGFLHQGTGTRIRGTALGTRVFTGVTGDVVVRLRGGDDLLRITNAILPGNVVVDLGSGHDEVIIGRNRPNGQGLFEGTAFGPLYVGGDLRLAGGLGNDEVFSSDAHMQGLGFLGLGAGDDVAWVQRPADESVNVDFVGNLTLLPGTGADHVDLWGLVIEGTLLVKDDSEVLSLNFRSVDVHANARIVGSEANDVFDISAVNVHGLFQVDTRGGNDSVRIGSIAERLTIALGVGSDRLDTLNSHVDGLSVLGGIGNDVFLVRNTRALDASFAGDDGTDEYREQESLPNRITRLQRSSIERQTRII